MYDSINFWLDRIEVSNIDEVANRLQDARDNINRSTGEVWTCGNLDNLRATVSMAGVSIKGSLAKFYFPNNTYTLNRHQVKEAIEMLSDSLSLPMNKARITRIDVSTNFIMTQPAPQYFAMLGNCRYYNRVQATGNTLYYHLRGMDCKRSMCFYDKAREMQKNKESLPNVYSGANLLRYESRWCTRLPQQFKEPEVIGESLHDSAFYRKAIKLWADNYFSIQKRRRFKKDAMDNITTVKDALNYISAFAIGRLPPDELQQILEDLKANKVFADKKYYSRLNQHLKRLATNDKVLEIDDLVRELDGEVKNVLAYMR